MMNKVLFIIYYSKSVNTDHHSCMLSAVYNNVQKIYNISIKKPIILISISDVRYVSIYRSITIILKISRYDTACLVYRYFLLIQFCTIEQCKQFVYLFYGLL